MLFLILTTTSCQPVLQDIHRVPSKILTSFFINLALFFLSGMYFRTSKKMQDSWQVCKVPVPLAPRPGKAVQEVGGLETSPLPWTSSSRKYIASYPLLVSPCWPTHCPCSADVTSESWIDRLLTRPNQIRSTTTAGTVMAAGSTIFQRSLNFNSMVLKLLSWILGRGGGGGGPGIIILAPVLPKGMMEWEVDHILSLAIKQSSNQFERKCTSEGRVHVLLPTHLWKLFST
jgi:hypothetical protein